MIVLSDMKTKTTVFIILLFLVAGGYAGYVLVMDWHLKEIATAKKEARDELKHARQPLVSKEKLVEAFGEEPPEIMPESVPDAFGEAEGRLMKFFSYLDQKEYVRARGLGQGTQQIFIQTVGDLTGNHPVIAGETESLFSLMKNMTYLFRVLGLKRINLIKDILNNESELVEQLMQDLFLWLTLESRAVSGLGTVPSLESSYEYASYFLQTNAGRSYLMRRDSKVRLLTMYYSVLILDMANDRVLNELGVDIRPHIRTLKADMLSHSGLSGRSAYLQQLDELQNKYRL